MLSKRWLLAGAIAVGLAAGGVSSAAAGGGADRADGAVPAAEGTATSLHDTLSALHGAPVGLSERYEYVDIERARGDLGAARLARETNAGRVYLVPASGGVCLASSSGNESGCYSDADLQAGATASAVVCAPGLEAGMVEVFGIATDGVSNLNVVREDGSEVRVQAIGNVYTYVADVAEPRPIAVTWSDTAGRKSIPAYVPADFREATCANEVGLAALK